MKEDDKNMETAYDPVYLHEFRRTLAGMFDLAINDLGMSPDEWQETFCSSEQARQIEADGNPYYLSNRSPYDFLREMLHDYSIRFKRAPEMTEAYWAGWVTATAQYRHPELKFADLFQGVPLARLLELYYPLHEEGETRTIAFLLKKRSEALDKAGEADKPPLRQ